MRTRADDLRVGDRVTSGSRLGSPESVEIVAIVPILRIEFSDGETFDYKPSELLTLPAPDLPERQKETFQ